MALTRPFHRPLRLLPRIARIHLETIGNKNPSPAPPNHRQKVGMAQAPNILVVEDDRETRTFAGWRIDFRLRELRNPDGARVAMTSAEFDLLRTFCERPGRVLSRDSLLDLTQGRNAGSFERSIDVLVSRIRRKIEPDPVEATMSTWVRSGCSVFTPRVEALTFPANG